MAFIASAAVIVIVPALSPMQCGRQITRALFDIEVMRTALGNFHHRHGRYPTTEEGLAALVPGWIKRIPRDRWGNAHIYRSDGAAYDLYSAGVDQIDQGGQGDDISTPEREEYCGPYDLNCRPDWGLTGMLASSALFILSGLVGLARLVIGSLQFAARFKLH